MSFSAILQFVIDFLSLGSLYALMALGMVVVYGILRLVNFAYGEYIMVAGCWIRLLCVACSIPSMICACRCSPLSVKIGKMKTEQKHKQSK